MNWLVLTILAVCSRALMSIATKLMTNRSNVGPATQAVLFTGGATLLSLLISPWLGGISFGALTGVWPTAAVMVLSQALGTMLFFYGQPRLEAGIAQIAFSSILIWGALLSVVFLGSNFSREQVLGIVILLAAILMVQPLRRTGKIDKSVLYIIAAAASLAVFQVTSAELANTLPIATYLLLAYGGATVIVWLAYFKRVNRDLRSLRPQALGVAQVTLFASACSLGYFIFAYWAYGLAPDRGVVVLLLTAQVVLSVILGIIFLRERDHVGRKLSAGTLALLAGLLIKS